MFNFIRHYKSFYVNKSIFTSNIFESEFFYVNLKKKIIASLCAASTVLSVAFATTYAAQTSIVLISGADIT